MLVYYASLSALDLRIFKISCIISCNSCFFCSHCILQILYLKDESICSRNLKEELKKLDSSFKIPSTRIKVFLMSCTGTSFRFGDSNSDSSETSLESRRLSSSSLVSVSLVTRFIYFENFVTLSYTTLISIKIFHYFYKTKDPYYIITNVCETHRQLF